ncbi:MAG: ABC transporter ATP-binding protein [Lentisphaeria bacterium]|nr:ABC transporter ATP-binding protein [Lentisphaeria bacterium]
MKRNRNRIGGSPAADRIEGSPVADRIERLTREFLATDDRGNTTDILSRFWREYLHPHRARLAAAAGIGLIVGVVRMLFPLTGRFLVDTVLAVQTGVDADRLAHHASLAVVYVGMLFGLWTLSIAGDWGQAWLTLGVAQRFTYRLREGMYRKLQVLHIGYFERTQTGKILSRVMDDVNVIRSFVASYGIAVFVSVSQRIAGGVLVLWLNWKLALVLLFSLPLYGYLFARLLPVIRRLNVAMRRMNSNLYAHAAERIGMLEVIAACAQELREMRAMAHDVFDYVRLGNRLVFYNNLLSFLAALITAVITAAILYLSGRAVQRGEMTIGDLIAFYGATVAIFIPIAGLTALAAEFQGLLVVLRRVFGLLDEPERVQSGKIQLTGMTGKVELDHVTFAYPRQAAPAIRDLCMHVQPGERIAMMGPSGSGKTTLFHLLLRFYDPGTGAVRVGGVEIVDADISSLRRHVSIVQQEPVIFSGTIAENITYGHPEATPAQIIDACVKAELHDFIMQLDVKYETEVGEHGVTLSGGQRQRLALATALLTDPEVLLLDDTSSALDAATEARVRATLNKALTGRTSLIITQRVSTARDCDRIVVLEKGRLSQIGTHADLVRRGGFYARICREQGVVRECDQ